jgi:hypothetical protein
MDDSLSADWTSEMAAIMEHHFTQESGAFVVMIIL